MDVGRLIKKNQVSRREKRNACSQKGGGQNEPSYNVPQEEDYTHDKKPDEF